MIRSSETDHSIFPSGCELMGKKILFLTDLFTPHFSPRLLSFVQYFSSIGAECTVCTEEIPELFATSHGKVFSHFSDPCLVYRFPLRRHFNYWESIQQALFLKKDRKFAKLISNNIAIEDFDLLIVSAYRTFPLCATKILSQRYGIPYIADCRDIVEQYSGLSFLPGGFRGIFPFYKRWGLQYLKKRFILQRTKSLQSASIITTVSPWHRSVLSGLAPGIPCYTLFNGYDADRFYPMDLSTKCFTILFTGRLMSLDMRDPSLLFEALSQEELRPLVESGLIEVAWYTDDHSKQLIATILKSYPERIRRIQRFSQMVSFDKLPNLLNKASIVLLVNNRESDNGPHGMVSTKLFEAMAVGKPILAIPGDEAIVEQFIQESRSGISTNSIHDVMRTITLYFGYWKKKSYTCKENRNEDYIQQFERSRIASTLARLSADLLCSKMDRKKI